MTNEAYPDLPDWIVPGARLAALGNDYTEVEVTHITRTQIVTVVPGRPSAVYRFDREPRMVGSFYDASKRPSYYRLRGTYFGELVQLTHPSVITARLKETANRAASRVDDAIKAFRWRRPYGSTEPQDTRPVDERALALFDEIENTVRAARREVLAILAERDAAAEQVEASA